MEEWLYFKHSGDNSGLKFNSETGELIIGNLEGLDNIKNLHMSADRKFYRGLVINELSMGDDRKELKYEDIKSIKIERGYSRWQDVKNENEGRVLVRETWVLNGYSRRVDFACYGYIQEMKEFYLKDFKDWFFLQMIDDKAKLRKPGEVRLIVDEKCEWLGSYDAYMVKHIMDILGIEDVVMVKNNMDPDIKENLVGIFKNMGKHILLNIGNADKTGKIIIDEK